VGFRRAVSFQAIQQQQLTWSKIQNIADLPVYQQHIIQQMTIYKVSNFFNIAPMTIPQAHFNRQVISNGNRQINKAVTSNTQTALSASNIFAKPQVRKPSHWIDKLQKNWIATATLLSVAVFGGVGALVSVKDKPAATQLSAKMSVVRPVYHDVAIVKVASVAAMTNPMTMTEPSKKAAISELQDSNKPRDNKHSAQAEKARDTKKSDKKQPNKDRKKTTSPDSGTDSNRDSSPNSRNTAKTDNKKANLATKGDKQPSEKAASTSKKSATNDKTVKQKAPQKPQKVSSSTTATDKKSAKKPDKKANNTMDNKADDKANNEVDNKINNKANNKPSSKSKTH
jgi:hypothetical protein